MAQNEEVIGMVIKLAAESTDFQNQIATLNRTMKVLQSDYKATASASKDFDDTLEGGKAKVEYLTKAIQVQESILESHSSRVEKTKEKLSVLAQSQLDLKSKLDSTKDSYEEIVKSQGEESEEAKKLSDELKKLQTEYDKGNAKINATVKTLDNQNINVNKAKEKLNTYNIELKDTKEKLEDISSAGEKNTGAFDILKDKFEETAGKTKIFGVSLSDVAGSFGVGEVASIAMGNAIGSLCEKGIEIAIQAFTRLISKVGEFIKSSFEVGTSFQAQMSKVQAIAGGSKSDLDKLTDSAREFGKNSIYSATEAAQAFEYTALAGLSTSESIEAMSGILNLAASSDMDLARASDIVTDNITAFGLEVDKANHLADVMAYTMSHTNTSTEQLGEAYKYCAATASSFGVSAEEASAWLGKLADGGVKASEGGTALNAMFSRLYGEIKTTNDAMISYGLTMYNADGTAKNFTVAMGEIQEKMKGMSEEERNIFMRTVAGTNQLSKFATMMKASASDVQSLTTALENCDGTSEKMVRTMTDNISGLEKSIGSKIESIKVSIFSAFAPLEKDVLNIVDSLLNAVSTLLQPIGSIAGSFLDMFSPIFSGFNRIISIISNLVSDVIEPFKNMFLFSFGEIGNAIQFVVDIIVGSVDLVYKFIHPIIDILNTIVSVVAQIGNAIKKNLLDQFPNLNKDIDEFIDSFKDGFLLLPNVVITAVNKCIEAINLIPGMAVEKVDYLTESYAKAMISIGDETADFVDSANNKIEDFSQTVSDITEANYNSFEEMYDAIMELDDETFGKLKDNINDYKNEYDLMTDALDEFEKEKSREIMKTWEKTNKSREGSMQYYLDKAKHQATVEEALHNRTAKEREKLDKEYTGKVEKELKKQKDLYEKYGINNYAKDYKEFALNEEKKTEKYKEELEKRSKAGNSILSKIGKSIGSSFANTIIPGAGILGAFESGTNYVPYSGSYLVGEKGPEIVDLPQGSSVRNNRSISNSVKTDMTETNTILKNLCSEFKELKQAYKEQPNKMLRLQREGGF